MYHFPSTEQGIHDKQVYESSLYARTRFVDVLIHVMVEDENESNPHMGIFDSRDILGNSFTYVSQATGINVFGLGSASIDTITVDLKYNSRYGELLDLVNTALTQDGSTIGNAEFYIEAGYGPHNPYVTGGVTFSTAYVPLGTFVVQDKTCSVANNKYSLKLQSLMTRFDKSLPAVFNVKNEIADILARRNLEEPDLLAILEWCCRSCKRTGYYTSRTTFVGTTMQLSSYMDPDTAYGSQYINSIPNITGKYFNITEKSGYLTYRDIIKDIATLCCSFATTDELGNLILCPFSNSPGVLTQNVDYFGTSRSAPFRLNDGKITDPDLIASDDVVESLSNVIFPYDLTLRYQENLGRFRIHEIRCVATVEGSEPGTVVEAVYDYPAKARDLSAYYDITGTKLLACILDTETLQDLVKNIYDCISFYTITEQGSGAPNYHPYPFDITTGAADFRLKVGDWVCCWSQFKDRLGYKFRCVGQIMRMTLKMNGVARYQSFMLPSANDRNASKRQSEAQGDYPTTEGGEAPPPPEPPVVIIDSYGQWTFGDEDAIREEIEAVGEPGRTYHVPIYGQWAFGSLNL